MIKSAIIGVSGPRARGLAEAYRYINGSQLVAVSSRQKEQLEVFGATFNISATYTDYQDMLQQEKPDLIHINTPPSVRLNIFKAAHSAGVSGILVEKPLAIQGEDFRAIQTFCQATRMKIAVNHQLHFHPRRKILQERVNNGEIGELRFIEGSAGMNMAYQGTHVLEAIRAVSQGAIAVDVSGKVCGSQGLLENVKHHYAPDQCTGIINYNNGLSALLRCGSHAPRVIDGPANHHKRITVYGDKGFIQWTMHGWESRVGNNYQSGTHIYAEEDILGQAAMTEAMIDWIIGDSLSHPLNIDLAITDFSILLGFYQSAVEHKVIDLPFVPSPDLLGCLRAMLC